MSSIHKRDDLGKLKKLQETKSLLTVERIKKEAWEAGLSLRYGRSFRAGYWKPETKSKPN